MTHKKSPAKSSRHRQVSKRIAHALRHDPLRYGLELEEGGWVPIEHVIEALSTRRGRCPGLTRSELESVVGHCPKQRFEIEGERMRARYGHSIDATVEYAPQPPPALLYHGTAPAIAEVIMGDGIRPMSRQYAHLGTDRSTAIEVGRRHSAEVTMLVIDAERATKEGGSFLSWQRSGVARGLRASDLHHARGGALIDLDRLDEQAIVQVHQVDAVAHRVGPDAIPAHERGLDRLGDDLSVPVMHRAALDRLVETTELGGRHLIEFAARLRAAQPRHERQRDHTSAAHFRSSP